MPASAIVVTPAGEQVLSLITCVTGAGFQATAATSFVEARQLLSIRQPELLLTQVRLAEYNGLHLVLRAKSARPSMAAIVFSTVPDRVLQAEAESMGATFAIWPVAEPELMAAIFRTIARGANLEPVLHPPFERRGANAFSGRLVAEATLDRRIPTATLLERAIVAGMSAQALPAHDNGARE